MTTRIDPKEVAAAYVKHGLTPYAGEFHTVTLTMDGPAHCCGLGALGYDNAQVERKAMGWRNYADIRGLHMVYAEGFVNGFDGGMPWDESATESYLQGYVDGIESHRLALIATGYLEDA